MEFDSPVLILLIAATGFLFCNWCNLVKYEVLRESGHRLYLSSVFYGFTFYILGYGIFRLQEIIWIQVLEKYPVTVVTVAELPGLIALLAIAIAALTTIGINQIEGIKASCILKAWRKNDIDLMCSEASSQIKPVTVTLDNRKVYIGLVHDSLEPGKEANLTIIPLYSGYRDSDTLELKLMQKYTSVDSIVNKLADESDDERKVIDQINDYRIVIPRERIVTVNIAASYSNFDDPHTVV